MNAPLLFGVDVADIGRIGRAMDYGGSEYTRHVVADDERVLHTDTTLAAAASVVVKESLIKAVGGRPAGFSWHDFRAVADAPAQPGLTDVLATAAGEVESVTGIALARRCGCWVRGASGRAVLERFPDHGTAEPVAEARWGWRDDRIIAIAILTTREGVRR
ncbi:hypothetical protein [Isoptericola croceus]|uniref:hypothetical protein n=1 Tax=Isoptericola croceus TaxID=3031406 RepID=UPI0023F63990|nr:hypothetical protein [Isoptericola croceus]